MRALLSSVDERGGEARADQIRSGVDPLNSFHSGSGQLRVSSRFSSKDVGGVVAFNPGNGEGAVDHRWMAVIEVALNLPDLDITRGCGGFESAPQVSVGSGLELLRQIQHLQETIHDIGTVGDEGDGALRRLKSVHEREEFRTVDSLAKAVQWSAFDAVELRSRSAAKNLQLDPGPAASAQARVTRVHAARPITAAPEAPRRCAVKVRFAINVLFARVGLLARRRHRSPVGGDDAAKPKGGTYGSSEPRSRDEVLGSVASLDLVVGLAFPVSVKFGFRSSVTAWAHAVGFGVLLGDSGVRPSRSGCAAEYCTVHFVAAVLGKGLEVTNQRAKISTHLKSFAVTEFGSACPELTPETSCERRFHSRKVWKLIGEEVSGKSPSCSVRLCPLAGAGSRPASV